jgi:kynurenine formamidase
MKAGWDRVHSLDTPEFWTMAPYMTAEACRWLFARGLKAIAFDFPQDRCIRDYVTGERKPALEENTTHVELLLKGVPMFEYLCNMGEITQARVEFIGLPLKIPGCDGAPVRAIAIEDA